MASPPSRTSTRRTTLTDVARLVNLDASTVSKVLSGSSSIKVKPETRERVLRAAAELNYRPHAGARGLSRQRTDMVGILMPDFTNPLYARMVRGAVAMAETLGYAALVAGLETSDHGETYRQLVHNGRIDGLIVATATSHSTLATELERGSIPHVFMNRSVTGSASNVIIDDAVAVRACLELLASLGHRQIGFVEAPPELDTARRRSEAARRATADLGLPDVVTEEGIFSPRAAAAATRRLLARTPRPTAIFCSNSFAALGILLAIHEAGLDVPGDISVMSVEEPDVSAFLYPPLTTIRLPYEQLGECAMKALDAILRADPMGDITVPVDPEPIVRASTGPPPAA